MTDLITKDHCQESDKNIHVDQVMVSKLASGITNIYEPNLKAVRGQLVELTKKQEVLCQDLHSENLKFSEAQCSPELQEMFAKIKLYREKLINIKKNMVALHEQSSKLKKRALKLEQQKQKEALEKVQQRDHEEQLIAKPSSS